MKTRILLPLLIVLLLAAGMALLINRMHKSGPAQAALALPAAAGDDAEAQFQLGKAYANGTGVPQDFAKAAEQYRKAAEAGNAKAQNNLALLYDRGQGVAKDDVEAAKWFRKAAEQGASFAQDSLGTMLMQGRAELQGQQGSREMVSQKAADQGMADAALKLGELYYTGDKGREAGLQRGCKMVHQGRRARRPRRAKAPSATCTSTASACKKDMPAASNT